MNTELTREESRAIGRIKGTRMSLGVVLAVLIIAVLVDVLFLVGEINPGGSQSDVPEWIIIPFVLAVVLFGASIGLINYMAGRLKDREKAYFVRTSIDRLKSMAKLTGRTEAKVFRDITRDLISRPKNVVTGALVADGWPPVRAKVFTELVESLIIKCEWSINYEDQVAGFRQMLAKLRWSETDAETLVGPVVDIIKDTGGRLTTTSITRSILKNIAWIVIIIILAPVIVWMLITNKDLDADTKWDFLQFAVMAVPAVLALGFNIASIIRKLGKRTRDVGKK